MLPFSELCLFARLRVRNAGNIDSSSDRRHRMKKTHLSAFLAWLALFSQSPIANASDKITNSTVPAAETAIPRLFAVPVLEPGKKAWVSVYDHMGKPVPAAAVSINGKTVATDSLGQANFVVPLVTSMTIGILQADGEISGGNNYEVTRGGYLVAEKHAKEAVDRIEESVVANEQAPTIAYAPSAIETNQPFVLIGKNLSGKADGDHIMIDGYDADVFSGSGVCLLATAPRRLSLGPLREMYVTTGEETSNTVEVDICKLDFSFTPGPPTSLDEPKDAATERAQIRVIGTNVPSLIEVRNLNPNMAQFSFSGRPLGNRSSLITPGGENNTVQVEYCRQRNGLLDVDTHLVADAPWSPDDRTTFNDDSKRQLVAELNRVEIIRLKRRLIAIEQRINEEQLRRTSSLEAGKLSMAELDRTNAQLRTLSNRQRRINAMVVARRAVYQALGGTDQGYRNALDDAAGGAAIAIDKLLAPLTSASLLASASALPQPKTNAAMVGEGVYSGRNQEALQLAELTRMWKKFPTKVGHGTTLAPPPPPYIPNLSQLGHGSAYDYTTYLQIGAPPPPMQRVSLSHRGSPSRHVTRATPSAKHLRSRSKSRHR